MKHTFLICCIWLFYLPLKAQLKVDAGNDVIVCSGNDDVYKIGGSPVASGGVEPYIFTWSGKRKVLPVSKYWLYASDILDDTTQSNPSFLWNSVPEDWFTLHLKVEDSEKNIQYDSLKIRRSSFIYNLMGARHMAITKGDSVRLFGNEFIDSNFWPFEYFITPSYGLTDSMDILGWAKPDTSILYYLYVVNPIGCISEKIPYLLVEVDTTHVSNNEIVGQKVQCNLEYGCLVVSRPNDFSPYNIMVTSVDGKIIHNGRYWERNLRLTNLGLKSKQLYIISIIDKNEKLIFKLFNI